MAAAGTWFLVGYTVYLAGAIACALLAAVLYRRSDGDRPERVALIVALAISAVWGVVNAAFGPGTRMADCVETARNLAWLLVLYRLFGTDGRDQSVAAIRPLVIVLAFVECLQPAIAVLEVRFGGGSAHVRDVAFSVSTLLRAQVAVGALVLVHNLYAGGSAMARQVLRWPATALAILWAYQLNLYTIGWIAGTMPEELVALHGLALAAMAILFAIGSNDRAADLRILPSRSVAFQTLSLLLIGGYLAVMVVLAQSLSLLGDGLGRLTQVGFVALAAVCGILWLPSRKVRRWLRVMVSKHLFQHRYDYRAEWLRFTGTIGRSGPAARALPERAAQALAEIADSEGAVLLVPAEEAVLELAGRWQWPGLVVPAIGATPDFVALLERTGMIVELDEVRKGHNRFGANATVPEWLMADPLAWAIVPLLHFDRLVGVAVIARPPHPRRLDWEDFDLLKVVGRQLASYLAEQAGHEALVEATRFDEFNRRIAFVMHDIKNLASQMSLLARNAERHADNPEFRKDMLVTLTKSAEKLNGLLARLNRYGASGNADRRPFPLKEVVRRSAKGFEGIHTVAVVRADPCVVLGDPDGLEQALVHLVQNAVDASAPGSPVHLAVSCDGHQGRVEVIDAGAGMSPRFVRDGLFKPFVSSKDGGFGIGAFEAREIVRAMGGRLEVESHEGVGTRFAVGLPLSVAAGAVASGNLERKVA